MEKNRKEKRENDDRYDRNGSGSSNTENISASASSMDSRGSSEYREGDTGSKKLVPNDVDNNMLRSTEQSYGNYQGEMIGEERFNYDINRGERDRYNDREDFNSRSGRSEMRNQRSYNRENVNQRPDYENERNRGYQGGSYQGGYNQRNYSQQQNYGRGFEGDYGSSESRRSYEGDYGLSQGRGQNERNVRDNEWDQRNRDYDRNRGFGNARQNSDRRNFEMDDRDDRGSRYGTERFNYYEGDRDWNQGRRENYRGPFNREQFYRSQPQGRGQDYNQARRYDDRRESSYGSQGGRGGFQHGGFDQRNREEERDRNYRNRWENDDYSFQQNQNRYNQGGERNYSRNQRSNDQGYDYLNQGYGNQGYGQDYGQNQRWNYPDDQWGPDYY